MSSTGIDPPPHSDLQQLYWVLQRLGVDDGDCLWLLTKRKCGGKAAARVACGPAFAAAATVVGAGGTVLGGTASTLVGGALLPGATETKAWWQLHSHDQKLRSLAAAHD